MSPARSEHWDRRWAEGRHSDGLPPDWVEEIDEFRAAGGRALDLAGGAGRVALWLARRGFRVTLTDFSSVALSRCVEEARAAGLEIEALELDLESAPLPAGPWDVIACFHYLQRDLFAGMREALTPGGLLVAEIATRRNLERHERPSGRFLLEPHELLGLLAPLELIYYREGWFEDHCVARGVARRPSQPD
jgi:tellurite methyltransferase